MIASLLLSSTIILAPGTYYSAPDVPAGTTVIAHGVTFDGSRGVALRGTGRLRWAPYKPLPVTDGHGMAISKGQGLSKYVGRHPDQAWSGNSLLKQVRYKRNVGPGKFWVGNGRIYVHHTARNVRVSKLRSFDIDGTLVGATVQRFSPTPSDGAAIRLDGTLRDVRVLDTSVVAVQVVNRGTLDNVLINRSGWMGISGVKCKSLDLSDVRITNVNRHREWATTPQSGAIKTSRCRNIDIDNMVVNKVKGHGLWFDQSTLDVTIDDSKVTNVNGRALFFEISHGLTVHDSYFQSSAPSKFAGASGVRVYDTTFVPGYITPQDRRDCPDPKTKLCSGALKSDRLSPYDPRITWINDVVVN